MQMSEIPKTMQIYNTEIYKGLEIGTTYIWRMSTNLSFQQKPFFLHELDSLFYFKEFIGQYQ